MPAWFKGKKPVSFNDLLGGIGGVHTEIAALPGAQRIDPALRSAQRNMTRDEVLDQYNRNQLFGKTETGEPIRGTLVGDRARPGVMPQRGMLRLDPESKIPANPTNLHPGDYGPRLGFYSEQIPASQKMNAEIQNRMRQAAVNGPFTGNLPSMYGIDAMSVKPRGGAIQATWYDRLPAKGKEMYAAMYDMLRASGSGNAADILTDVNIPRRLGNVASHGIGHGDLKFVAPISESGGGYSSQAFSVPVRDADPEIDYLEKVFSGARSPVLMRGYTGPEVMRMMAVDTRPLDVLNMTPEQQLGYLMLREAQLAGVYGPAKMSGVRASPRFGDMDATNRAMLQQVAEPSIIANPGRLEGAFGPQTLGRQLTTEETVWRMLQGETPEEIADSMVRGAPPEGYKGRYKAGGLVAANA